jgi:hypothetical protein
MRSMQCNVEFGYQLSIRYTVLISESNALHWYRRESLKSNIVTVELWNSICVASPDTALNQSPVTGSTENNNERSHLVAGGEVIGQLSAIFSRCALFHRVYDSAGFVSFWFNCINTNYIRKRGYIRKREHIYPRFLISFVLIQIILLYCIVYYFIYSNYIIVFYCILLIQ